MSALMQVDGCWLRYGSESGWWLGRLVSGRWAVLLLLGPLGEVLGAADQTNLTLASHFIIGSKISDVGTPHPLEPVGAG